mgnify:CR=1 FL=1
MFPSTSKTSDQAVSILSLLNTNKGMWVGGEELARVSGTSALGARLRALRVQGWIIATRSCPTDPDGFAQYQLVARGARQGRSQIPIPVPPHPHGGRAWTEEEVRHLRENLLACVEAEVAMLRCLPHSKELDWIDLLLASGEL